MGEREPVSDLWTCRGRDGGRCGRPRRPAWHPPRAAHLLAAAALLIAACSGRSTSENVIKPVTASVAIDTVTDTTAVFLKKSMTAPPFPDFVLIDVMVRDIQQRTFDDLSLEIRFDSTLAQVGSIDPATPFGTCTFSVSGSCTASKSQILCCANANPANVSGDLLIGVTKPIGGISVPISGDVKLLTLGFVATTVGRSQILLVDSPAAGECGILQDPGAGNNFVPLPIPCVSGNATITATR